MIKSYLLQQLNIDQPKGFSRSGGTMRYYMSTLGISQSDWIETIDYALKREFMAETGEFENQNNPIYNWTHPFYK